MAATAAEASAATSGSDAAPAPAGQKPPVVITVDDVEHVISTMAKIPTRTIAVNEKGRLAQLEADLRKVIFGQDHAIDSVVSAIRSKAISSNASTFENEASGVVMVR